MKKISESPRREGRQLGINIIANTISYGTSVIIAFYLTPYLIRTLGKEAYSFFPMANNFVNGIALMTIALNSMASRFISIEIIRKDYKKANMYFISVLYSNIFLALILLIPMVFIVIFLDSLLNIPVPLVTTVKTLFGAVFLSALFNTVTNVFGVAVVAKNRIDLRSYYEIAQCIIKVVLYIVLFALFKPTIVYVGVIVLFLAMCNLSIQIFYTKTLLPEIKINKKFYNFAMVKELLKSGIWNSVQQVGTVLLSGLALTICNIMWGAAEGGNYSIIINIPNLVTGLIVTSTAVFIPVYIKRYAEGDIQGLIQQVISSQKLMGLFMSIPIAVFAAVGTEFFTLWVPGEDAYKLQLMSLMTVIPLIFMGVTWPVANLNIVLNKVKVPALYLVGSGVLNIILIFIFDSFSNLGVYSVTLAYLLINCLWLGLFIPIYPCIVMRIKWWSFYRVVGKNIITSVIIFVTVLLLKKVILIQGWFTLLAVCVIAAGVGIIVNFVAIYNKEERTALLKRIKG